MTRRLFTLSQAVMMILLCLVSVSAHADSWAMNDDMRLEDISTKLGALAQQRQSLRQELNRQVNFDRQASSWFEQLKQVQIEIDTVESHPQTTYKGQNKQNVLASLKAKRNRLMALNGGATIDGQNFSSMQQLDTAFKNRSKDAQAVGRKYQEVLRKISALEKERLSINRDMVEEANQNTTRLDRVELKRLQEDKKHVSWLLSEQDIWYVGEDFGPSGAVYMHRDRAVQLMTEQFMQEVINKDRNARIEDFKDRLKFMRDFNNHMRQGMREELVRMEDRIVVLQQKINLADIKPADIAGCWVLYLPGSDDLPQITIVDEGNGTYVGYLSYVGNLIEQFRRNHRLFRVHRTSETSFGGTEYSYNSAGQAVNIPLNIHVNQGRKSLTYLSDGSYQLGECRIQ